MSTVGQKDEIIIKSEQQMQGTQSENVEYKKRTLVDLPDKFAGLINDLPLPRYFVTLAFIVYGVIAFSKKENGVTSNDLSLFLLFISFIILTFVLLVIGRDIYKRKTALIFLNNFIVNNSKKVVLVLLIFVLLLLIFKTSIAAYVSQFINLINK